MISQSSQIKSLQDRTLEAESTADNLKSSDLQEVSAREKTELKSTDTEAETSTSNFPISDLPEISDLEQIDSRTTEVSLARYTF